MFYILWFLITIDASGILPQWVCLV